MNTNWHSRFMQIAETVSSWSKDPSTKVGAVIVNPETKQIISTGYNGFPRGMNDDPALYNNREEKYKRVVHAEQNAILQAAKNGYPVDGCWLYVAPLPPCSSCSASIVQAGIKKVLVRKSDFINNPNKRWEKDFETVSLGMFTECGIELEYID